MSAVDPQDFEEEWQRAAVAMSRALYGDTSEEVEAWRRHAIMAEVIAQAWGATALLCLVALNVMLSNWAGAIAAVVSMLAGYLSWRAVVMRWHNVVTTAGVFGLVAGLTSLVLLVLEAVG